MLHAKFSDMLSEGQIEVVNSLIKNIINLNVGRFRKREELIWLGNGVFQTPDEFDGSSLLVWLEGQLISPEKINGIEITSTTTFRFKMPDRVTEKSMVTCYYTILLVP